MILVLPMVICLFSVVCALFGVLNVFQMDICARRRTNIALNKALSVFAQECKGDQAGDPSPAGTPKLCLPAPLCPLPSAQLGCYHLCQLSGD